MQNSRSLWNEGWLLSATALPSPNFDLRPETLAIDMVVIHHISLPKNQFGTHYTHDLFCNRLDPSLHPDFEALIRLMVSSHFLIERGGALTQFVSCNRRAWHAGQSEWQGRQRCNDFSIGIELEGSEDVPFTEEQYQALQALMEDIQLQYPIEHIVGHSDIAPGRKIDPGPYFEWQRIKR